MKNYIYLLCLVKTLSANFGIRDGIYCVLIKVFCVFAGFQTIVKSLRYALHGNCVNLFGHQKDFGKVINSDYYWLRMRQVHDYVYGCPGPIQSDQGKEFESKLFKEICRLFQIDKTRTTPCHPQSDGMVEIMNRMIKDMLS